MTTPGITHVACAFDHVIESFRNGLYPGYKTGAGVDPKLIAQFPLAEEAVSALGLVVWPMVEFEADDALASATARFKNEAEVEQIVICSPDKDLAQLVSETASLAGIAAAIFSSMKRAWWRNLACARSRSPTGWGWWAMRPTASPASRAGAQNRRPVLAKYEHLEAIPDDPAQLGGAGGARGPLADKLRAGRADAELFRTLATLRLDVPLELDVADLELARGVRPDFAALCHELGDDGLARRVEAAGGLR